MDEYYIDTTECSSCGIILPSGKWLRQYSIPVEHNMLLVDVLKEAQSSHLEENGFEWQ